jgi:hypothetical protein
MSRRPVACLVTALGACASQPRYIVTSTPLKVQALGLDSAPWPEISGHGRVCCFGRIQKAKGEYRSVTYGADSDPVPTLPVLRRV